MTPSAGLDPEVGVAEAFAVVCHDVRGQYGSPGQFYVTETASDLMTATQSIFHDAERASHVVLRVVG
jgi:hypothetical protein